MAELTYGVGDFMREWLDDSCPFVSARTSGSTGAPKPVSLLKADMKVSARATNKFFGIGPASVLALPLSVTYIAGKMMVVRALEAGCRLVELPVSNSISLPPELSRVTLLPVVPSQVESVLAMPSVAARIENLLIGGAPPTEQMCRRLCDSGLRAFVSYGMTETCSHVALAPAAAFPLVYTALPGISFSLDGRGCLVVEAPAFSWKRLVTNDVVDLHSPQSFSWRGRIDNVINSGGIKLFPEELEKEYAPALGGRPFCVASASHPVWGQCAAIVFEGTPADVDGIRKALDELVADRRRLPKFYYAVEALPRTASGKVIRRVP